MYPKPCFRSQGYFLNVFSMLYSFYINFGICRLDLNQMLTYVRFITILRKANKMKILMICLCLVLTACANNGANLETMCLHKDPNAMTDREVDMCKAYLQRPIVYQN